MTAYTPDTRITTEDQMSEGALSTSFRAAQLLMEVARETSPTGHVGAAQGNDQSRPQGRPCDSTRTCYCC